MENCIFLAHEFHGFRGCSSGADAISAGETPHCLERELDLRDLRRFSFSAAKPARHGFPRPDADRTSLFFKIPSDFFTPAEVRLNRDQPICHFSLRSASRTRRAIFNLDLCWSIFNYLEDDQEDTLRENSFLDVILQQHRC